jgi:hypothetical protein
MDDLIDRVTSSRIFKQIADFAWGLGPDEDVNDHMDWASSGSSIFEDAEDREMPRLASAAHLLPPHVTTSSIIADDENIPRAEIEQEIADSISPAINITHIQAVNYAMSAEKPPLVARYPEVFTFVDKENEVGTGVSLTEVMVWQFNAVYQGEQKLMTYQSQINVIANDSRIIDQDMDEISAQLEDLPEYYRDDPALEQIVNEFRQEVEDLAKSKEELSLKMHNLEVDVERVQDDIRYAKSQLFLDMKDTLAAGGLLEPLEEDVEAEAPAWEDAAAPDWEGMDLARLDTVPMPVPTASDIERAALQDAREAVLNDIVQKQINVQDAQEKFDSMRDHYEDEYATYLACVEDGTVDISKTEFDGMMLLESRETTANLIKAEEDLEQARNHARELGLALYSYDQESGFADFKDDGNGYTESIEAALVARVDRRWIQNWMNENESESAGSPKCDDWDAKTVDISDSVSMIAEGRERIRIDRWRDQMSTVVMPSCEEET